MAAANIIPFELPLPLMLPTIEGNVDYRDFRGQLLRIDQLLVQSGLETQLLAADLQRWLARQKRVSAKAQQNHQVHARRALRCNLARILIHEDYRGFAARLADSPLLQFFCAVSEVDRVVVPSKSTLQRYFGWWPEAEVRPLVQKLLVQGSQAPEQLGLAEPLDLETAFLDSTCLSANLHYPVDWVLLRDATRTLMGSVRLIRDQGLRHRMEEPETFLSRMNKLCIKMTHVWRRQDPSASQRLRKQTLRQMDRLVGTVRNHARRYRQLLDERWEQTAWTRPQAEQVLGRMDQVLAQLPKARQQARQRILQGQLVPNEEKILSLYETDVHVIVRKKAGAEVEFGNTLFLAENPQGARPCCRAAWRACRKLTRRVPRRWRATGGSTANSTASASKKSGFSTRSAPARPGSSGNGTVRGSSSACNVAGRKPKGASPSSRTFFSGAGCAAKALRTVR
jgi:hypothetical protein